MVCFEHVRPFSKERKEKEKKEIACKLRCVRTLLIKSAEGSRHLFPESKRHMQYMYLYLPTSTYARASPSIFEEAENKKKIREIKKRRPVH